MTKKKDETLTKSQALILAWKNRENGKCYYCGDTHRLGLDRIDNSKGHTKDNVVICCYDCNVARSNNFSYEEMLILGKTIRKIKSKRNKSVA